MATASLWDRAGQSKYTGTTFLQAFMVFSLARREAEIIAVVLPVLLLSDMELTDQHV